MQTVVVVAIVLVLFALYLIFSIAKYEHWQRVRLWKRAPHDLAAAEELRRRLLDDADADRHAWEHALESGQQDHLNRLETSVQTSTDQLARLDEMIRHLR